MQWRDTDDRSELIEPAIVSDCRVYYRPENKNWVGYIWGLHDTQLVATTRDEAKELVQAKLIEQLQLLVRKHSNVDYRDTLEVAADIAKRVECYDGDDLVEEISPALIPLYREIEACHRLCALYHQTIVSIAETIGLSPVKLTKPIDPKVTDDRS